MINQNTHIHNYTIPLHSPAYLSFVAYSAFCHLSSSDPQSFPFLCSCYPRPSCHLTIPLHSLGYLPFFAHSSFFELSSSYQLSPSHCHCSPCSHHLCSPRFHYLCSPRSHRLCSPRSHHLRVRHYGSRY